MNILFWASYAFLWILIAIQGFALLEILRQIGLIRHQLKPQQGALFIEGSVKEGEPLPELAGYSAKDLHSAQWKDYLDPVFSVVVLLSTHCNSCRAIAQDITRFATDIKKEASIVVILEGRSNDVQEFLDQTQINRSMVIVDEEKATANRFGVLWNPAAITIHKGRIGKAAVVNDIHQLSALVESQEVTHVLA